MTKLSMNGKNVGVGGFVKSLVGTRGKGFADGFHVHTDWLAKTISFDQAIELCEAAKAQRVDHIVPADKISFGVQNDRFVVIIDDKAYRPNAHSFPQMSTKIGVLSSSILREMDEQESADAMDAATMVQIAKNAIRNVKDGAKFFVRTYDDGTLRAWFSDQYAPVDNRWFLETLREFLPEGRLSHWRSDEDTLWGNVLIPDKMVHVGEGDDSDFGTMLSVANCEIGKRQVETVPSIFRAICMNGCIWGQEQGKGISRRHRGVIKYDELKIAIANAIATQLPIASKGIDKLLASRKLVASASMETIFAAIANEYKLSPQEACATLEAFELLESDHKSLYGAINSVTRAGQAFSPKRQFELDEIGGLLLDCDWDRLNARAQTLSTKDVDKLYGVAV